MSREPKTSIQDFDPKLRQESCCNRKVNSSRTAGRIAECARVARDFSMIRSLFLAGLAALPLTGEAFAADARAGRQKVAGVCQACHGMDGLSKNPESPNLAGQLGPYLVKAITEYRSETRKNESMNIVAKDLTDDDIANIAAYYSSIQIEVIPP